MNSYFKKSLAYAFILFVAIFGIFTTYAADPVAHIFSSQSSSGLGSNNSVISVDGNLSYINKGNNSSVVGNYFEGYYYDSVLGYFQVDALPNPNENVRIIGSSSQCATGYGYKLGGYAYSEYFGFVDFDYNSSVFVYYCAQDSSLYGHAYSEANGFQNFEGISFPIEVESDIVVEEPTQSGAFVNDESDILDEDISENQDTPPANSENSNFSPNTIQNNLFEFEVDRESLFYIIK